MMDSLALSTFQAHDRTVLDFVPGVNVIVGASDSGKSSILRALRWAVENRPAGDALKSHWSDGVSVTVETDTHKIVRNKGRENVYQLDGETFKAFGQDVPEPIKAAFGFHDVNMAAQLDAPFLLSSTPGEVARYLNSVVGLDAIDTALQGIASNAREVAREVKRWTEDAAQRTAEMDALAWVPDAVRDIEEAERIERRISGDRQERERLAFLVAELAGIEEKVVPDLDGDFAEIDAVCERLEKMRADMREISRTLAGIESVDKLACGIADDMARLETALAECAPTICQTCGQEIPA